MKKFEKIISKNKERVITIDPEFDDEFWREFINERLIENGFEYIGYFDFEIVNSGYNTYRIELKKANHPVFVECIERQFEDLLTKKEQKELLKSVAKYMKEGWDDEEMFDWFYFYAPSSEGNYIFTMFSDSEIKHYETLERRINKRFRSIFESITLEVEEHVFCDKCSRALLVNYDEFEEDDYNYYCLDCFEVGKEGEEDDE